jgi:hypothetical protein
MRFMVQNILKKLSLITFSILFVGVASADNFNASRREERNIGFDAGFGGSFYSLGHAQFSFLPVDFISTFASVGFGDSNTSYSLGADYFFTPQLPVTFSLGLELSYVVLKDKRAEALAGNDFGEGFSKNTSRYGMVGFRVGGDWVTEGGFHMGFGAIIGMPLLFVKNGGIANTNSGSVSANPFVQVGYHF